MKKRYIKITRSGTDGSYIQPQDAVLGTVEDELLDCIDYLELGDSITLTVIEMDEREYEALPEFEGW